MDDVVIARILACYGVVTHAALPIEKGYRNESHPFELLDGSRVNLILYKSESGILKKIKNANQVSDYLFAHGFPTRQTLDPRIIKIQDGSGWRKYGSLYSYLPGQTIAWESYTQKHIKLLGKAMSDMHASLRQSNARNLPDVACYCTAEAKRMRSYFSTPAVADAIRIKLNVVVERAFLDKQIKLLQNCQNLSKQPLHMDFVRSNVLFGGPESGLDPTITGILDFEKTAQGHPVFDIARTLAFLLVDCKYKAGEKVRKYFLQSGYNKRGASSYHGLRIALNMGQVDLLDELLDIFLLHDFYKFLLHSPYENLWDNEHFVRTRDMLIHRNCIRSVLLEKLLKYS